MVETLPPLTYGKVIGRFLAEVGDTTDDVDAFPDGMPMSGHVYFTMSPKAVLVATATPAPATVIPVKIDTVLDVNGYLTLNGAQGVYLIATDSAATNPINFTYKVEFDLLYNGVRIPYGPFDINVPAGTTVDLTVAAPVPSNGGAAIVVGPAGGVNYILLPAGSVLPGDIPPGTPIGTIVFVAA